MRRTTAALLVFLSLCSSALAASTINPNVPAQNAPLASAPVRGNFAAAYADINNILGGFAGSSAPGNPTDLQSWWDTTTTPVYVLKIWNANTGVWIAHATLNVNTGVYTTLATAGSFAATAPLAVSVSGGGVVTYSLNKTSVFVTNGLNELALANVTSGAMLANCTGSSAEPASCTWNSYANTAIGSSDGMLPYRTGGSWGTISTGTSGTSIPLLDGTNSWSAIQTFNGGAIITGSFTATGLVGLTNLSAQATNSVLANVTSGSASPTALSIADCTGSASALQWVTNTGFSCATIVSAAGSIAVGTTTITSGTSGLFLYNNAGVLGEAAVTGSLGSVVLSVSPTIATPTISGPTITGSFTATGLVTNAALTNPSVTVNGTVCTLGSSCTAAGPLNVGSSVVNSGSNGFVLYNNAGVLGNVATSGTGNVVLVSSPTINNLTGTGTTTLSSTAITGTGSITSASANALAVGPNGTTNPAFNIDASTASSATGINIKSAAAAGGVALSAISSGTNENLTINAKGSGTITLGSVSTGAIIHTTSTTLSAALTYGGVALNNAVTGTGNMVLSASPTFTGTITAAAANFSSAVTSGAHAVTSSSANALVAGLNGATNPAFQVDASTASSATGIKITSAAATGGVAFSVVSSGTNEGLSIDAKGTGDVTLGANASAGASFLVRIPLGLGNAGAAVGQAIFSNLTSGTITVQPTTGALGSSVLTLPAVTDTIAGVSIANAGTGGSLTASDGGIVYSDSSRLQILAGTSTAGLCLLSASNTAPTWGSCSGAAAVSSVSASNSTLTVSPTTGSVLASLNLANANVWTAAQSFTASGILLKGSSTGYTTFASANAGASNYTVTIPATSMTLAATDVASQVISGGAVVTSLSQSAGSLTVNCGARPLQYLNNSGAYTITAPTSDGSCMLLVTNTGTAGATTFSGFTVGSNTGDTLTTTNSSRFIITVVRIGTISTYIVKALQ